MSQAVVNSGLGGTIASSWRSLASVAATPATRPHTTAAHAYRAYAATPAQANKHFMGGGSWSNLR